MPRGACGATIVFALGPRFANDRPARTAGVRSGVPSDASARLLISVGLLLSRALSPLVWHAPPAGSGVRAACGVERAQHRPRQRRRAHIRRCVSSPMVDVAASNRPGLPGGFGSRRLASATTSLSGFRDRQAWCGFPSGGMCCLASTSGNNGSWRWIWCPNGVRRARIIADRAELGTPSSGPGRPSGRVSTSAPPAAGRPVKILGTRTKSPRAHVCSRPADNLRREDQSHGQLEGSAATR